MVFGGVILQRNRVFVHDEKVTPGVRIQPYYFFDKLVFLNRSGGFWRYFGIVNR